MLISLFESLYSILDIRSRGCVRPLDGFGAADAGWRRALSGTIAASDIAGHVLDGKGAAGGARIP
jgi:hypothetical protein